MHRRSHRHSRKKKPRIQRTTARGTSPGTLPSRLNSEPPVLQVISFSKERLVEQRVDSVSQLAPLPEDGTITWINVDGLGDSQAIRQIGQRFGLHALALEDVINVHQRAKVEPYSDHLYIVVRLAELAGTDHIETEQISIFLGKNYVLTFQERPGDCFDPVRERLRTSRGRIRNSGTDYLAYALIDSVIDSYFPLVGQFADRLDDLEDDVAAGNRSDVTARIHEVRNDLLLLRRSVRPHREALNELARDVHPLITDETRVFLRDCYDHTFQLIDLLEVYREMCADLRDYYLSLASNRMNEIMKVLTIIATIFIPLSFVAGLYGMNFNTALPGNMPELNLPYGYFGALGIMATIAIGMLAYFWRNGWIGPAHRD